MLSQRPVVQEMNAQLYGWTNTMHKKKKKKKGFKMERLYGTNDFGNLIVQHLCWWRPISPGINLKKETINK